MNIDTSFYDERIDYYERCREVPFVVEKYKGFGTIEFWLDLDGLKWIINFWKEAKAWYIKKETERLLREQKE